MFNFLVYTVSYGSQIDQSQRVKLSCHIIIYVILVENIV